MVQDLLFTDHTNKHETQTARSQIEKMFTPDEASEEKSEIIRTILENTVKLSQACDEFAKDNPKLSKYTGIVLKYAGCALGAIALYSAAQIGAVPLLITDSSMAVQNELFAAVVENGAEALIDKAASYGRTEEESLKFADGTLRAVEIGLDGVATLGLIKCIKNGPALRTKCTELRANLKQRVSAKYLDEHRQMAKKSTPLALRGCLTFGTKALAFKATSSLLDTTLSKRVKWCKKQQRYLENEKINLN